MTFEEFLKSRKLVVAFFIMVGFVVLIVVFAAGVFVGLEKAKFSYSWNNNYMQNFGGRGPIPSDHNYLNAHGSDGTIIKIDGKTLTIKGRDGIEKNIIVEDGETTIEENRTTLKLTDLKVDENVVIIGSPDNQGEVEAKLIRVLPSAPVK